MTRKIIVTIDDEETSDLQASYYVMKIIQEGLLSETNKQKHYILLFTAPRNGTNRKNQGAAKNHDKENKEKAKENTSH